MNSANATAQKHFPATRWSVILEAQGDDNAAKGCALQALCQAYWHPLYAYARFRSHSPEDAQDLTQGLFARLLGRDAFQQVARANGKLRTFLLVSMNNHMANQRRDAQRLKRGGGTAPLSIDLPEAESRLSAQADQQLPPDKLFERQWALSLLERVLDRLRQHYSGEHKAELFEALKGRLSPGISSQPYQEIAAGLGMSESAVKVAVHRMRKRYRNLLLEEVSTTLDEDDSVKDEIHYLFGVLAAGS